MRSTPAASDLQGPGATTRGGFTATLISNEQIACPLSKTKLIAMAVVVGLFLLVCLTLLLLSRCSCRRRRASTFTLYPVDVEATPRQQPNYAPPPHPCPVALPEYSAQLDDHPETPVEPPEKIHPAVHPYPRY
ncbi:hypothetical protein B0H14DRAFT_2607566 [Mycena olivaceomarginata]|nr:hypothetical protein B0H14DRAFT_2607566 [Mycena olivaceomarginata]